MQIPDITAKTNDLPTSILSIMILFGILVMVCYHHSIWKRYHDLVGEVRIKPDTEDIKRQRKMKKKLVKQRIRESLK